MARVFLDDFAIRLFGQTVWVCASEWVEIAHNETARAASGKGLDARERLVSDILIGSAWIEPDNQKRVLAAVAQRVA